MLGLAAVPALRPLRQSASRTIGLGTLVRRESERAGDQRTLVGLATPLEDDGKSARVVPFEGQLLIGQEFNGRQHCASLVTRTWFQRASARSCCRNRRRGREAGSRYELTH